MITIELGNISSEEQVQKIINAVDGKTMMNFKVDYGVYAENYMTSVTSNFDETLEDYYKENPYAKEEDNESAETQATKMLLWCLAEAL